MNATANLDPQLHLGRRETSLLSSNATFCYNFDDTVVGTLHPGTPVCSPRLATFTHSQLSCDILDFILVVPTTSVACTSAMLTPF